MDRSNRGAAERRGTAAGRSALPLRREHEDHGRRDRAAFPPGRRGMRVLHLVKTSDGAHWAVQQASELRSLGVDVHVALPSLDGRLIPEWKRSGATLHLAEIDWPASRPWRAGIVAARARDLVRRVRPDIVHSHFFGTTMIVRRALSRDGSLPVVFQVPGPLHLEHAVYRRWDVGSAGPNDWWIASSRAIERLYTASGVPPDRVFTSYYGIDIASVFR